MPPELPTDWRSRARIHASQDLIACALGGHRDQRGIGIWRRDGSPLTWLARAHDLAWLGDRRAAAVVFERGHRSAPPLPATQIVARVCAPEWEIADELAIEPSRGGVVGLGSLFELRLDSHVLWTCAIELDVPEGWLPGEPWSEWWAGPTEIEPLHEGARMTLPGGDSFDHPAPLPAVLRLPPLRAFAPAAR